MVPPGGVAPISNTTMLCFPLVRNVKTHWARKIALVAAWCLLTDPARASRSACLRCTLEDAEAHARAVCWLWNELGPGQNAFDDSSKGTGPSHG